METVATALADAGARLAEVRTLVPTEARLPSAPEQLHRELRIMLSVKDRARRFDTAYEEACRGLDRECRLLQVRLAELARARDVLALMYEAGDPPAVVVRAREREAGRLSIALAGLVADCEELAVRCFAARLRLRDWQSGADAEAATPAPAAASAAIQTPPETPAVKRPVARRRK